MPNKGSNEDRKPMHSRCVLLVDAIGVVSCEDPRASIKLEFDRADLSNNCFLTAADLPAFDTSTKCGQKVDKSSPTI